ncbi:NUAK family SNF1-like kinase 1 [Engraulis encrasicolus]|uniref:NUAK family SNF1-like kinase 1 n=1 Tax=Engraulis encrasicolus TaxID=184585 RepID=UPI002FD1C784
MMETVSVLQQQLSHPGTLTDQYQHQNSSTGSGSGSGEHHCSEDDALLPVDYPQCRRGSSSNSVKKHLHKHNLKHRYELQETLGRGTYGKVKKAIERHTGRVVAIKSIRKDKIKEEQDMVHIRREIEIMSSLRHPHIITIYEVFENKDKIVIVMEYASKGELYEYISERRRLSERETRHFFRQIVSAVHFCHKNGIVHRDLKLENVLLDENCNIKIADFGLSNLYSKDKLLHTFCGSPLYASPEIVNGRPYKGPEVDSWALGVLLYTLVYGTMPFDGADHKKLIRQISNGEYREPTQSSDARGLIRWMLMVNPERRATVEDIANHWWVNWGWKSSVCDCEAPKGSDGAPGCGSSPMLARFIDWQNRTDGRCATTAGTGTGKTLGTRGSETSPPMVNGSGSGSGGPGRQRVRRSSKENDAGLAAGVVRGLGGQVTGHMTTEDKPPGLKRPKGILKTRGATGDHRSQSLGEIELRRSLQYPDGSFSIGYGVGCGVGYGVSGGAILSPGSGGNAEEEEHDEHFQLGGSPAKMAPTSTSTSTLPKKGILKNNSSNSNGSSSQQQQRESGYYSSPERSESSELLGGDNNSNTSSTMPAPPAPTSSPTRRATGRKGILKRNGKYSTHSSSSISSSISSNSISHSDLAGTGPDSGLTRSQSRPSSLAAVGDEDMGLSCAPLFPVPSMDWPPSSPKHIPPSSMDWPSVSPGPNIRACLSAEDLLPLASGFRGLLAAGPASGMHGMAKLVGVQARQGQGSPPGSPGDNGSFSLLGDLDDMTQVYQQALDISNKLL